MAERWPRPDRSIFIDYTSGSHYWSHKNDKESRYHERHRRGEMEICVHHVEQVLILSESVEATKAQKQKRRILRDLRTESTMARMPLNEIFIIPWSDEFVDIPGKQFRERMDIPGKVFRERKALPSFMMLDFSPKAKEYKGANRLAHKL
mgnify:CR=1 FL=1